MNTCKFTVADYLLLRLKELGLDKVFQVPGDYVQEFMTALEQFNGIDAVGDITELGAGYAADGYARYKGIGAVSVQYGVGTFSVLNAIAGAYVERNPVVVITASPSLQDRKMIAETGVLFHHSTGNNLADKHVFDNVTVASEILTEPSDAPRVIDYVLQQAVKEKRPVYLEAWQNVWGAACHKPDTPIAIPTSPPNIDMQKVLFEKTLDRLIKAQRPLVMLGIEITRLGLQDSVETLLSTLNIPYTTSTLAKSVISERYGVGAENFVGTYAGEASSPQTYNYVSQCDAILALGVIFTDDYLTMLTSQADELIRVNMDGASIGNDEFFMHISLTDLIHNLTQYFQRFPRSLPPVNMNLLEQSDNCYRETTEWNDRISFDTFFRFYQGELNKGCPIVDYNLILGESSSLYMAARLIGIEQNRFVSDAAWGSLGHETGCSLGVALADKRRSVVIAGDGGFMMMCQTLSTLKRNNCNTAIFVMSNQVYAIEQSFVDICAFSPHGQFAPFDELPGWDYEALSQAFGVKYLNIRTLIDAQKAFSALYENTSQPFLIKVDIERNDLAPAIKTLAESVTGQKISECNCN